MNPFQSFFNSIGKKASAVASKVSWWEVGRAAWSGRNYEAFMDEGYRKNAIVFTCVDMIATAAASVPWYVATEDKKKAGTNKDLERLLIKPNATQQWGDIVRSLVAYRLLTGNSYLERVTLSRGVVGEVYSLPAQRMKVIPSANGFPAGYEYAIGENKHVFPVDPVYGTSDIAHLKKFNPTSDWYGMAPMEAALYSIDQHNSASTHNKALLDNGARPSGALIVKNEVTASQRQELEKAFHKNFQGAKNAGKPMFLAGGDFNWVEMGINPKDLDWIKGKDLSAREIGLVYKVPSQLLGIEGSQTFANYQQAMLFMWQFAVIPELVELQAVFNNHIVKATKGAEGYTIKYDLDSVDALNGLRETLWGRLEKSKNAGIITINEARASMGYDPIVGGDELYMPAAQLPLSFDRTSLMNDTTPTP